MFYTNTTQHDEVVQVLGGCLGMDVFILGLKTTYMETVTRAVFSTG